MTARRIIAAILIIVASLLAPFGVGALWAERTLTDTQQFVETVAPLADSPEVQQAVATAVSGTVIKVLDVESRLKEVAPDSRLVVPIAAGVNSAIQNGITSYTQSDRFGQTWATLSEALHRQFVALLNRDGTGAVTLQDGQIVLDTAVAVDKIRDALVERGVPFVDQLDLGLAGQTVVIANAPNLQSAADAISIFLPIATWLWLLVLMMFVGGVLLWPRRSRGLMWAGLGLMLGGLVTWAALGLGQTQISNSANTAQLSALVGSLIAILLRFLITMLLVMVALGVAMLVAGWLAGGTDSGTRARLAIAGLAHRAGEPLADGPVGRVAARQPMLIPILRGTVLVVAVVVLFAVDRLTPGIVIWTFVGTAVALLLVEIVEGAGLGRDTSAAGAVVVD